MSYALIPDRLSAIRCVDRDRENFGFDLAFAPEQILVSSSGDLALDRGTYRLKIVSAGRTQTDTGKYVVVWRKVGGEWKAAADIFNSDVPPAGG